MVSKNSTNNTNSTKNKKNPLRVLIEKSQNKLIEFSDKSKNNNYTFFYSIFFILIILSLFGYYIFFFNPYNILSFIYIPIVIIFLLVLFYFIHLYWHIDRIKKDTGDNAYVNIRLEAINYTQIYFKLIALFIFFFIIFILLFNLLQVVIVSSLNISFFLTLAILFIIIALLNSYFKITDKLPENNIYIEFLTNLIFYIPCLITDAIDYIKKDYKDTPSTTKILFIILVIIFSIYGYFLHNKIKKNKYGIILVNDSKYLNTDILSINKKDLNEKILESKPFYEKAIYDIQIKQQIEESRKLSYSDLSNADISNSTVLDSEALRIPYYADSYSRVKYLEGFTSVIANETFPIHLSISEYDRYILQQLLWKNPSTNDELKELVNQNNTDDITNFINDLVKKNKYVISLYEKTMLYLSTTFNPNFTKNLISDLENNNYHYSFSFWLYLVPLETINKKDIIYTYGNRPSMYFNHNNRELTLEYIKYETNSSIVLYKTNNILFQKWNNIVINNNYGTYDIFINGKLMGSYKNIVDYKINENELLKIGSKNNKDIGGISNFYYYEFPLDLNKITEIYNNRPQF